MAGAKLEKTTTSGIFRRAGDHGTRYVVVYRDEGGKQRRETARTLDDARALKRRRESGETNAAGRMTFAEYALDWIDRHPCRESTRHDYRAHLERWIIPFIGDKRKLADVSPLLANQLVARLRAAEGRSGPLRGPVAPPRARRVRAARPRAARLRERPPRAA